MIVSVLRCQEGINIMQAAFVSKACVSERGLETCQRSKVSKCTTSVVPLRSHAAVIPCTSSGPPLPIGVIEVIVYTGPHQ